jgi:hypothetical protein
MLSQWSDESCLLPFIAGLFGEADALADRQAIEPAARHAVPMKINLVIIGCSDEAMIFKERFDYAARYHLVGLDVPVPLAKHIFELTVSRTEGILNRHFHIVVAFANARIVIDIDVRGSWHRRFVSGTGELREDGLKLLKLSGQNGANAR